jgi:hypothetical protein
VGLAREMSGALGDCFRGLWLLLAVTVLGLVALNSTGCGAAVISVGRGDDSSGAGAPYEVLFSPDTNAGWAGWCFGGVGVQGGQCGNGQRHAPVIEESWNSNDVPPETVGIAVTTDKVARVEIGEGRSFTTRVGTGISVPTRTEKGLPTDLRVAVVRVEGKDLFASDAGGPSFISLDAHGVVIPQPSGETASQLIHAIPTRSVPNPGDPARGICEIKTKKHLSAYAGSVITEVHGYSGFIGEGFISCASTSYELAGFGPQATVLLSASHPGTSPPPLPKMKALPGHPGVFATPGGGPPEDEENLFARRAPGAWLLVGQANAVQKLALLEQLRVIIHVPNK